MQISFSLLAAGGPVNIDPNASADLTSWTLLIVYLLIAIVFSFLCSIAEAAMLKVTRGFIDSIRDTQTRAAGLLERFQTTPEEPLAAILTLNTIAHTIGAAGVGHQAAVIFGEQWLGVCSAIMTLLILIGSEIIPKTLGATHWRKLAPPSAMTVRFLELMLKPFIKIMMLLTDKITHQSATQRSRLEIESTVRHASGSESVNEWERRILHNVFALDKMRVKAIMTPRVMMFTVPEDLTVAKYRNEFMEAPYSRIPVTGKDIDDITGYVLRSDVLKEKASATQLRSLKRELDVFPETNTVRSVMETLATDESHIAQVVSEHGTISGLVTFEDILETLMGFEIVDELDQHRDMQLAAKQRFRLSSPKVSPLNEETNSTVPKVPEEPATS